jgi:glycosidase
MVGGLYHPTWHAQVLYHVRALGQARRDHPSFYQGTENEWYLDRSRGDYWAYSRVSGSDAMLTILNRGESAVTMSNGLSWAGLPSGSYQDVLSGATYTSSGDSLTITVPGRSSMVLVAR